MTYTKTTWVNDSPPDINAENLNKMEQGIADAQFPEGGTTGQVLKKTENGIAWGDDQAGTDAVWGNITGDMADQEDLNNALTALNTNLTTLSQTVSGKADAQAVDQALALKADKTYVDTGLANQKYFYIDSEGYGCINYDLFQTA